MATTQNACFFTAQMSALQCHNCCVAASQPVAHVWQPLHECRHTVVAAAIVAMLGYENILMRMLLDQADPVVKACAMHAGAERMSDAFDGAVVVMMCPMVLLHCNRFDSRTHIHLGTSFT